MCGIIGANAEAYSVEDGFQHMRRGNDENRFLAVRPASFGFQRHAVIAPAEHRTQPYRSGGHVTLANGELFGYREINERLKSPVSASSTDIEVLHQYILENGVGAVSKLNMMLAGAVYKEDTGRVHLFRDWVGEEPLHYAYNEETGEWCFGSTIAAVVRATLLPLERIHEVTPGSIVTLSPWGMDSEQYFDIEQTPTLHDISYVKAVDRTRELLETSAKARTWTDVPVGALVSGGTDSFITIYLLLKYGNIKGKLPIYTFHCADSPVDENSDLFHAKRVAAFFGDRVEHRIITASREAIVAALPNVVEALEDRRGRDFNVFTAVYNRFLGEAIAKQGVKVIYEGEGPDEALGTYSAWRSWQISTDDMSRNWFRKRLVTNLHKGVLLRTSKVMMHFGPLECRTFFLDRDVLTFFSSLPPEIVRKGDRRKGVLIDAFADVLPRELLERPKARPQDATGITRVLDGLTPEQLDFKGMFADYIKQIRQRPSWAPQLRTLSQLPPPNPI